MWGALKDAPAPDDLAKGPRLTLATKLKPYRSALVHRHSSWRFVSCSATETGVGWDSAQRREVQYPCRGLSAGVFLHLCACGTCQIRLCARCRDKLEKVVGSVQDAELQDALKAVAKVRVGRLACLL